MATQADTWPHADLQPLKAWLLEESRQRPIQEVLQLYERRWHHRRGAHREPHEQPFVPRDTDLVPRSVFQESPLVKVPKRDRPLERDLTRLMQA